MRKVRNSTRNYKVTAIESIRRKLEFISANLESWINDNPDRYKKLPEWPEWVETSVLAETLKKIKYPVNRKLHEILTNPPFKRYKSWEDFFDKRDRMIDGFSKTGRLDSFEVIPFNPDDEGAYVVLKRDCDDMLKIINICSPTKDGNLRYPFLKDVIEQINRCYIYLDARYREKKEMAPHKDRSMAIIDGGRKGAKARWAKERERVLALHERWQSEANRSWDKNPNLSKSNVAKFIVKKMGGNPDYIRRIIKKPTT